MRVALGSCLVLGACVIGSWIIKPSPTTPNVILFYIDDLGYADLSCTGAVDYQTPNLDRMAVEGTRFTNFLAAQAVCSASRASLMTGCYPNRVGISGALGPSAQVGLNPNEETLAELLKARGYATGILANGIWVPNNRFCPSNRALTSFTASLTPMICGHSIPIRPAPTTRRCLSWKAIRMATKSRTWTMPAI